MLTATKTADQHTAGPLTHRICLMAGSQKGAGCASGAGVWVQVRRYHPEGSYVLCGQVIELRESGGEWFKVETSIGMVWANGQQLRMCSGDGRCTCEPAQQPARLIVQTAVSTAGATAEKTQQSCGLQRGCDFQPNGYPAC